MGKVGGDLFFNICIAWCEICWFWLDRHATTNVLSPCSLGQGQRVLSGVVVLNGV
jgi:hypothetical protein